MPVTLCRKKSKYDIYKYIIWGFSLDHHFWDTPYISILFDAIFKELEAISKGEAIVDPKTFEVPGSKNIFVLLLFTLSQIVR